MPIVELFLGIFVESTIPIPNSGELIILISERIGGTILTRLAHMRSHLARLQLWNTQIQVLGWPILYEVELLVSS